MRLINIDTLEIKEFVGERPQYAILSHRWTDDELTFQDFANGRRCESTGYAKLLTFCEYVRQVQPKVEADRIFWRDADSAILYTDYMSSSVELVGVKWIWIDTCCIDQRHSAELTEAINSMWQFYQDARYCVAHFSDVVGVNKSRSEILGSLRASRWFTRGWTLQELLAPRNIVFCDRDWRCMGALNGREISALGPEQTISSDLVKTVREVTGIPIYATPGRLVRWPKGTCVAQKLSWAANRKTTRPEDMAYCLLGLLGVNMPLLYGEGERNAFHRLQMEYIQHSNDESIFAWSAPRYRSLSKFEVFSPGNMFDHEALLAPSIECFRGAGNIEKIGPEDPDYIFRTRNAITRRECIWETPAARQSILSDQDTQNWSSEVYALHLNCFHGRPADGNRCTVVVQQHRKDRFWRAPWKTLDKVVDSRWVLGSERYKLFLAFSSFSEPFQ